MRLMQIDLDFDVKWRLRNQSSFLLDVEINGYRLVNLAAVAQMKNSLGLSVVNHYPIYIFDSDEYVLRSNAIVLATETYPKFSDESFFLLTSQVSKFLTWIRYLSFQSQIPSVPNVGSVYPINEFEEKPPPIPIPKENYEGFGLGFILTASAGEQIWKEAAQKIRDGVSVPIPQHLIVDAYAAYEANNFRLSLLLTTIAIETFVSTLLDEKYNDIVNSSKKSIEYRLTEIDIAGDKTITKDPIYESLQKTTDFSILLYERTLYIIGKSLKIEMHETYRLARKLYTTRNKIVHRGYLSEEDKKRCFDFTREDTKTALRCASEIFQWYGYPFTPFPRQKGIDLVAAEWDKKV